MNSLSEIPPEIIECARTLEYWMKSNGREYWQLNGVCDRKYALACEEIVGCLNKPKYEHLLRVDTLERLEQ